MGTGDRVTSVLDASLADTAARIAAKEVTSVEVTKACLARIAEIDGKVKAFLRVDAEGALREAAAADASSPRGPLHGVPVALKDNINTAGLETTAGSRILKGFVPLHDATVTARLRAAGAVVLGKTNLDEFAMGSSTENSGYQLTHNPYSLECTPGGSSGGSAAAVASGQVFGALGSDTGGSIRQPASLCNVVGLKPTWGRVSRSGVIAYASSLDQVGPLARTVRDAALLLQAISGKDPHDATSASRAVPSFTEALDGGVKGLRIGLPREYFVEGMEPEVAAAIREAAETLRAAGAVVEDVSLPHTRYAMAAYYLIATGEASSNLARYDGVRFGHRAADAKNLREVYDRSRAEGFGAEVKRRIMLGTFALSAGYHDAYYVKAQRVRTLIARDFEAVFQKVDVVLSAASPACAWKLGEKLEDPLAMYLMDVLTLPTNLAGLPGISVPTAKSSAGLPIGAQLLGRPFDEVTVLRAARALERERSLSDWRPNV
ncbi:MAG: Asp-tRNA(Asn)/Glu-tRNA(Gln) amidotransferase subunit GatA [Archangium sp.]|nr:Asp-tRNA(Asn)/Glu-tRNA(Gln) amidotransferase subunit GatA [Archangium sp.]